MPTYIEKENKLWESFSQSPSPNRTGDVPVHNDGNAESIIKTFPVYYEELDKSPSKIKDVIRPENILKNEIYMMMLKGQQPQGNNLKGS